MKFDFACSKCGKKYWLINYDTEEKIHEIKCVNCGWSDVLEYIFSTRRRGKSAKPKKPKPVTKLEAEAFDKLDGEAEKAT